MMKTKGWIVILAAAAAALLFWHSSLNREAAVLNARLEAEVKKREKKVVRRSTDYGPDGEMAGYTEYDARGNSTEMFLDGNYPLRWTYENIYDGELLIQRIMYDDGEPGALIEYAYDEAGERTLYRYESLTSGYLSETRYVRTEKADGGWRIDEMEGDECTWIDWYDADGKLLMYEYLDSDDRRVRIVYEYGADGETTGGRMYVDGRLTAEDTYEREKNRVRTIRVEEDGTSYVSLVDILDDSGRTVERITFDKDGNETRRTVYEYWTEEEIADWIPPYREPVTADMFR